VAPSLARRRCVPPGKPPTYRRRVDRPRPVPRPERVDPGELARRARPPDGVDVTLVADLVRRRCLGDLRTRWNDGTREATTEERPALPRLRCCEPASVERISSGRERVTIVTIPAFTAAGVLPPFTGAPAASISRSPYVVGLSSVIDRFGISKIRCDILEGWLRHRAALHKLGINVGYQWIAGSFCEELTREPGDVDTLTFFQLPAGMDTTAFNSLVKANLNVFHPIETQKHFRCDAFFVRLQTLDAAKVETVNYWFGLFSHRRNDLTWKGILQVGLSPTDDAAAASALADARKRLP
jgi:hypothetical protein